MKIPTSLKTLLTPGLALALGVTFVASTALAHPYATCLTNNAGTVSFRLNEAAAAENLFQDSRIDWASLPPGWQAVRAAALGAIGQAEAARQLARQVRTENLKPEERALIQSLLPN